MKSMIIFICVIIFIIILLIDTCNCNGNCNGNGFSIGMGRYHIKSTLDMAILHTVEAESLDAAKDMFQLLKYNISDQAYTIVEDLESVFKLESYRILNADISSSFFNMDLYNTLKIKDTHEYKAWTKEIALAAVTGTPNEYDIIINDLLYISPLTEIREYRYIGLRLHNSDTYYILIVYEKRNTNIEFNYLIKKYNITTTDTRIYESGFRLVESQEYINFMNLLLDKNKIMETEFAKTYMEHILHIPYDNDLHFDIDFIVNT